MGLIVLKEEDFSVRLSREEMTNTGAVFFGLIGAGVETAMRNSADKDVEKQFKVVVGDYDPREPLVQRLRHHIQSSGSIRSQPVADSEDKTGSRLQGVDSLLTVTLREWGLRRCPGPAAETVQAGFTVHGKLVSVADQSVMWEREELYLDGDCRPWPGFRTQQVLLQEIMPRAIDNLASKLVYEILFP
jgi:hypothetical protein